MSSPIHINTINIGSTFDVRLRYFSNWRFDVVFDPSVHNVERPTHEVAQQKVVFTCIENNLAKFQNGKLPRSFNVFLSKIRDDAETTKYWKLKKQWQNRHFCHVRSIIASRRTWSLTLELQERVFTGMKLLVFIFDGQRVVTSSITNASKIALRHFGQLYCELMILEIYKNIIY